MGSWPVNSKLLTPSDFCWTESKPVREAALPSGLTELGRSLPARRGFLLTVETLYFHVDVSNSRAVVTITWAQPEIADGDLALTANTYPLIRG